MEQWTMYLPAAAAAFVALTGYVIARSSAKRFRRRLQASASDQRDGAERAHTSITRSIGEALVALKKVESEVRHSETAGTVQTSR